MQSVVKRILIKKIMEIITKEQMDKLDGLIEKYRNPEVFEVTVTGVTILMCKDTDTSPLTERRKMLITQEQCKNIVTVASALLKTMPDVHAFAFFLSRNSSVFYFDPLCFMDSYYLTVLIDKDKVDIENLRYNVFIPGVSTEREKYINYNEIVKTYTELTNFYKYIEKYPLTKDDVLRNISAKQNC